MAEGAVSFSALKKLEEQLTCAICHDLYINPKILPCFHSFCQQCLEGLPQDCQGDNYIFCPTCRHRTQLPKPTGAADFPAAFHINNLKEVYNLMIKMSGHQLVTCDICTTTNATGYCKDCAKFLCEKCISLHNKFPTNTNHMVTSLDEVATFTSQLLPMKQEMNCPNHNKPLEIFCETCEDLICQHCTVRIHRDHDYDLVSDCYPKHCQKLKKHLKPVRESTTAVTDVLISLTNRESDIREQGEVVKKEIHIMAEEMIDIIHQSERQLTREVDAITGSKLQELSKQKTPAEKILDHLKDCQEFVEQSLVIGSPQQLVTSTTQMMKRMTDVTKQVNIEEFIPKEKADIHFIKNRSIFNTLSHIGDIVHLSPSVLEQCKVSKIGHNQIATTDKTVTFPLAIQCSDSSLFTVPLSSLSCSVVPVGTATQIKATITTTTQPGVYTIYCSHINRGRYNVNVNINGVHIEGTSLVIPFNPYLNNITPLYTIPELNRPCGIAFTNNGSIIVSERNGHRVTILDRDGEQVNAIGHKSAREIVNVSLTFPCGVAITPDNFILVADNHKIQKISMDGECIASFGRLGKGPLEFNIPCGITISPLNGHIYIADYNNHRIQVLESDLTFSCEFGTEGSAEAQLKQPRTVAIDRKGLVYVADTYNNRIQKFTPEGEFLCQIGEQGAGPGQLHHPSGIVIDDNSLLYVTELGNHRVTIFTTDGHFKRTFGRQGSREDQFKHPCEIKFDKDGYLYVCDYDNNRLVVY